MPEKFVKSSHQSVHCMFSLQVKTEQSTDKHVVWNRSL